MHAFTSGKIHAIHNNLESGCGIAVKKNLESVTI